MWTLRCSSFIKSTVYKHVTAPTLALGVGYPFRWFERTKLREKRALRLVTWSASFSLVFNHSCFRDAFTLTQLTILHLCYSYVLYVGSVLNDYVIIIWLRIQSAICQSFQSYLKDSLLASSLPISNQTVCYLLSTIVTLFYSIYLLHKRIVFNLSLTLMLVLSPKLLNFIILLLFLNLSTDQVNERIKYKVLLTHINLSKLVNLLTSALFFHSLHNVVLGLPLLSPLVVLLSPLVSK